MKKSLLAAFGLTVCIPAFSATGNQVCTGAPSATDAKVTALTDTNALFIKTDFKMKCSANVFLVYDEFATYVSVGAASKKGKTNFGGTSEGGAVAKIPGSTDCTGGCTAAPTPPSPSSSSS